MTERELFERILMTLGPAMNRTRKAFFRIFGGTLDILNLNLLGGVCAILRQSGELDEDERDSLELIETFLAGEELGGERYPLVELARWSQYFGWKLTFNADKKSGTFDGNGVSIDV